MLSLSWKVDGGMREETSAAFKNSLLADAISEASPAVNQLCPHQQMSLQAKGINLWGYWAQGVTELSEIQTWKNLSFRAYVHVSVPLPQAEN